MSRPPFDRLTRSRFNPMPDYPVMPGQFTLPPGDALIVNGYRDHGATHIVPDASGTWSLASSSGVFAVGMFARGSLPDDLDAMSIRAIGGDIERRLSRATTTNPLIDVSPLEARLGQEADLTPLDSFIAKHLGSIRAICHHPRTHLRTEEERLRVDRVRRVPQRAVPFLASHTEDWAGVSATGRAVIPRRVLGEITEELFSTYENRVVIDVIDQLVTYLSSRLREVRRIRRAQAGVSSHERALSGSHDRQDRVARIWGHADLGQDAVRRADTVIAELERLIRITGGLRESPLYQGFVREVGHGRSHSRLVTSLVMTNIFTFDENYRKVALLWKKLISLKSVEDPRSAAERFFRDQQVLVDAFSFYTYLLICKALLDQGYILEYNTNKIIAKHGKNSSFLEVLQDSSDIIIKGDAFDTTRFIPLPCNIANMKYENIQNVIESANKGSSQAENTAVVTAVVYVGTADEEKPVRDTPAAVFQRIASLGHEVTSATSGGAGMIPVSPWDITSVERIGRQIRWSALGHVLRSFPSIVANSSERELRDCLALNVDDAKARVRDLSADRLSIQEQIDAHPRAIGENRARSERISAIRAREVVPNLRVALDLYLTCPTVFDGIKGDFCAGVARPRVGDGINADGRLACECPECGTRWGTQRCPSCQKYFPTLLRLQSDLDDKVDWNRHEINVDDVLGIDVLSVPYRTDTFDIQYICPNCGT